jgi:CheY-like chemotaxis protein
MSKIKVLTIDDDRAITAIFRKILERTGRYEVHEENFAPKAVATAVDFQPDVVLLDWQMPIMDGAEVAGQIMKNEELIGTPIIFVTGFGNRVRRFGHPCLEKPINSQTLIDCIEQSLASSDPAEEHAAA